MLFVNGVGAQISSFIETMNHFCFVSGFSLTFWSKFPPEENICCHSSYVFPYFKLLNHFIYLVYLPIFPKTVWFRVMSHNGLRQRAWECFSNLKSKQREREKSAALVCSSTVGCEDWDKATARDICSKENLVLCCRIPSSP